MRAVAVRGAAAFQNVAAQLRLRQPDLIGGIRFEENQVHGELSENKILGGASPRYFLPLPDPPQGCGLIGACFRPTFQENQSELDIELALIGPNEFLSFGLRFERGREDNDTHSYAHVQFTKNFDRKPVKCGTRLPYAIPQSYPALPTRCTAAGDTWIAVLVSIFGLSESGGHGLNALLADPNLVGLCRNPGSIELLAARATAIFLA
jgi:hypothetical protein